MIAFRKHGGLVQVPVTISWCGYQCRRKICWIFLFLNTDRAWRFAEGMLAMLYNLMDFIEHESMSRRGAAVAHSIASALAYLHANSLMHLVGSAPPPPSVISC